MARSEKLVVMVGADGRIITFNAQCERVTGFSSREAVGKNLVELLVPSEWRAVVVSRFKNASEQDLREPHKNPWLTKTGGQQMIEWSCSFIPSDKGKIIVG